MFNGNLKEEIHCSGNHYRQFFESSNDGCITMDADTGQILDINPSLLEITGYKKEQFLHRIVWEIGIFRDIVSNQDEFNGLRYKRHVRSDNVSIETEQLNKIDIEFISYMFMEDSKEVIQWTIRKISARTHSNESFSDLKLNLESIVQGSYIGTWEWNVQTGETVFNEMWAQIIGYSLAELYPTSILTWELLAHPDDLKQSAELLDQHFAGELPCYDFECRVKHKNGKWVWVHDRGCLRSRTKDGKPLMMYGTHTDITKRKCIEKQLEENKEHLLKVIAEKEKFFTIIAHDLRSPFNIFLGYSRLLAEELNSFTTEEIKAISLTMNYSATNLFHLLENLLEWSQIQQGLVSFDRKMVKLLQVVNESLVTILELSQKKNITINCAVPGNVEIFADNNILQTVIRNLVSNAVKFTPRGGMITIEGTRMYDDSVEVTISDTGIGISPSILEDLFRLDVQTNRKGTENEPSTGLGLIICKDFIEMHGGKITVESEVEIGSKFLFTIPAPKTG